MLAIKNHGGQTLVQQPAECSAPFMPLAALELNCVDFTLPCKGIISHLLNLAAIPAG
jgi:two-component system chemotaxis response regulator CheB